MYVHVQYANFIDQFLPKADCPEKPVKNWQGHILLLACWQES